MEGAGRCKCPQPGERARRVAPAAWPATAKLPQPPRRRSTPICCCCCRRWHAGPHRPCVGTYHDLCRRPPPPLSDRSVTLVGSDLAQQTSCRLIQMARKRESHRRACIFTLMFGHHQLANLFGPAQGPARAAARHQQRRAVPPDAPSRLSRRRPALAQSSPEKPAEPSANARSAWSQKIPAGPTA